MNATELLELTLTLKIVLWIEFIVYMGIGLYEIFDSFAEQTFNSGSNCFNLIAADSPEGPPPTITTS